MTRIILHIDFDSFFASVEQQYQPELRGKPLGVTAHNGRTAIIAASREAKKAGVRGIMRSYDALKICPEMKFVSADFTKYWKVSKEFIEICKNFSPFIEVFSIDELFMEVTMTAHLFGGIYGLVEKLKKQIREKIGEYITVSVGISHNKLLAKLGSGLKKPDGVVEIKPSQIPYIYKIAKLTDICGIGFRIEKRLNQIGIYTLTQLSVTPLASLVAEFGNVEGHFLYNVGKGIDTRELTLYTTLQEAKSISRNYCLPENQYDDRIIVQNIYELCEELGIKLRRIGRKARHAGIYLRGRTNFGGRKTYDYHFNTGKEIFKNCFNLLPQDRRKGGNMFDLSELGYVRQISVWVSYLEDIHKTSIHMFYDNDRQRKLVETIDYLNDKFGDHTVRNAFLLYADKLTTVPNGFMADKYERMKLAEEG